MKTISIVGNVGTDPKIRTVDNKKVAEISVGVGNGKDDQGNYRDTDWFKCSFWERRAEVIEQYVLQGHKIGVTGELTVEKYTDRDGKPGFSLVIKNASFTLIGEVAKNDNGGARQQQSSNTRQAASSVSSRSPF
jgi:single-strand DNA-binding protein